MRLAILAEPYRLHLFLRCEPCLARLDEEGRKSGRVLGSPAFLRPLQRIRVLLVRGSLPEDLRLFLSLHFGP